MKTKIYLFVLLVLFCSPFASALFCSNTYYIKKVYDVDLNSTSLEYIAANLGNWSADKPNYNTTTELSNIFALATRLTDYFNKTEVNSTGFIGLTCSNGQIMKWSSGKWECATDSSGLSAIYSGNNLTYIAGGNTVNVNRTTLSSEYVPYTNAVKDVNLGAKKLIFSTATTREVGYLVLDGDEDLVSTGYWGNFENVNFSVSAWVKIESNPSTTATIIAHDGFNINQRSWRFQINTNKYLRADFYPIGSQPTSTTLTANTSMSTGKWHHVAMVRVYGGLSKLYLDGQEVASGNLGNNSGTIDVETGIGAVGSGGSRFALFFDGGISQLAVLDRELTQDEILKIYSTGRIGYVGDSTDYNGLYLFSGTPNDFNDYSGNNHNGTGYGNAYTDIENVNYTSLVNIYNDGNNLVINNTNTSATFNVGGSGKFDGNVDATSFSINSVAGWSGNFTNGDGNTVTVTDGLITDVS